MTSASEFFRQAAEFTPGVPGPNDPARWELRQHQWDTQRPQIEHTKDHDWFSLHTEPAYDDGDRQMHAVAHDGTYVGQMYFGGHNGEQDSHFLEGAPEVRPDYRRRGINTAMYNHAEELDGRKMAPASSNSADAAAFWKARSATAFFRQAAETEHIGEASYEPDDGYMASLWDRWHPTLQPNIHRALGVDLPSGHPAHDISLPVADRAHALLDHVTNGPYGKGLGMHWTDDGSYAQTHMHSRLMPGETGVILHAKTPPRHHVEDNEWVHEDRAIRGHDTEEREVPVKHNAPLEITGVTWHSADGLKHHGFDQPITKRATHDGGEPIHRGMAVVLSPDKHAFVHDHTQPLPARAHMLLSEIQKKTRDITTETERSGIQGGIGGVGEFWSPHVHKAREYANQAGFGAYRGHEREHNCGDPDYGDGGCHTTHVVLHSHNPGSEHHWNEIMHPGEEYHPDVSWRLPVRPGTKMGISGVSWGEGHDHMGSLERLDHLKDHGDLIEGVGRVPKLDHHYDFSAPVEKHASTATAYFRQAEAMDGHLDLYHRTTPEAADAIYREKRMKSHEGGPVFFSTFRGDEPDAQGGGYGEGVVHVRVPEHLAQIDDEFPSGEEHYQVHQRDLRPEHFIDDRAHHALGASIAKQAAAETGTGIMVALFPPREVAEQLAEHGSEPVDQLHVTLAYLGKTADYTPEQLAWLPELVRDWAKQQQPVTARIGGVGTFHGAEHVLWASVDIPGGAQLHTSLDAFLQGKGYRLPSEHGWNPHLTLSYVDQHKRFMPKLPPVSWTSATVAVCIGGQRTDLQFGAGQGR